MPPRRSPARAEAVRSPAALLAFAAAALGAAGWPTHAAGQGSRPPVGVYRCVMPGFTFGGGVGFTHAGEFTLMAGGRYKGLPTDQRMGDYRFHPGTQAIEWLSGPFAGGAASARYVGVNSSGHTINMKLYVNNQARELWCNTPV